MLTRAVSMFLLLGSSIEMHPPVAAAQRPGYISVWLDRDQPYRRGDQARVYLRTDRPAYLTVVRVDTDGRLRILFPRDPADRTRVGGGRDFEITRSPGGSGFRVDDYPGIGYLLAIASPSPFTYDNITRGDHWDYRAIANGRVQGDPYVALARLAANISQGSYRYDIAPYYVDRRYQYPRFACYECHTYASYQDWDPYGAACTRFRIVIYDDPAYYPYRYNQGRNVVVARPAHPPPRYVFKDATSGSAYVTRVPGSADRRDPAETDRTRTSADVGGPGTVPAPDLAGKRPDAKAEGPRAFRRRRESGGTSTQSPAPESTAVRRAPDRGTPRSTGEPELRRRRPERR
jgi:hypothetical protein